MKGELSKMRKLLVTLLSVMLTVGSLALIAAAPVAAGSETNWPGCATNNGNNVAIKIWENSNYGGAKECEPGKWWQMYTNPGSEASLRDTNFGNNNGVGKITNFNDKMSSFVAFNKSSNPYCLLIFWDVNLDGFFTTHWVPGKGSKNYSYVAESYYLNPAPWSGASSVDSIAGGSNGISKSACLNLPSVYGY